MRTQVLEFLQKEVDLEHIPGAVIQVSHKGESLLQEAVGYRSIHREKLAMTTKTIFDLASLTKVVAATPAILKLIDLGEVRLDDSVSYFLPDFSQHGKDAVKIRHILTHTSGLLADRQFHLEDLTKAEIYPQIYAESLQHPVGEKVVYSDLGYMILSKVVETVTEMPFAEFVNKTLYEPLEMYDTGFNPTNEQSAFAATEYSEKIQDYKRGIVHDEKCEVMGGVSGHAGLFSTINDLENFALMIENKGAFKGKQILSASALTLARENQTPFGDEYRGLGWIMKSPNYSSCGDYFPAQSYGHTGFTGTSIWFDPTIQLHVILLTNRVHFGREPHIIRLRPRLHNIIRSYF